MKNLIKYSLVAIAALGLTTSYASFSERLKATGESVKGKTQDVVGQSTDHPKLTAKGKANRAKGSLRQTKEDAKDIIND